MKATTLLERQHRSIQQLCDTVADGSASTRASLLPQLASDLAAHIEIKEALFDPAVRDALGAGFDEAAVRERHALARRRMDAILAVSPSDVRFDRLITELRACLDPSFEEEEQLVFPRVERALTGEENRALAARMMRLHHACLDAGTRRV